MKENYYSFAYDKSRKNRSMLIKGRRCGCFYCLKFFDASEIEEFCPEEETGESVTAICPYCGIDSILPETTGYTLTQEFLSEMNKIYFG